MLYFSNKSVVISMNEIFYLGIKNVLEDRTSVQHVEHVSKIKRMDSLDYNPELIIFDWDSYDHALKIMRNLSEMKSSVLVFSQESYPFIGSLCCKYNASGYLNKNTNASNIASIINDTILSGRTFYESEHKKNPLLSKNEYIVAKFLCDGSNNNAIAQKMSISEKTVSTYKMRIFQKLGIKSIVPLCHYIKMV